MESSGDEGGQGIATASAECESRIPTAGRNLCKILFGMLDTGNKGSIPTSKLFDMIVELSGKEVTEEEKKKIDKRNSKETDLHDFELMVEEAVHSDGSVKRAAQFLMPLVDKNQDGFVGESDLLEVYGALGLPEMDTMPLIRPFDKDGDGKLNPEEFGNLLADSMKMLFSFSSSDESETSQTDTPDTPAELE